MKSLLSKSTLLATVAALSGLAADTASARHEDELIRLSHDLEAPGGESGGHTSALPYQQAPGYHVTVGK